MKYGRVDQNQREIVDALITVGATVHDLSGVGGGCPDLLVGFRGENHLLELKFKRGKLNDKQVAWHDNWRGSAVVVRNVTEALMAIGAIERTPPPF